jgi:hypothetical protein
VTCKKQIKQSFNRHVEAGGERRYSFYSFTTSALDGVTGQRHDPGALYPRYPSDRRLGGPQSQSGHKRLEEKILSPLPGIEPE